MVPPRRLRWAGRPGALSSSPPFRLRSARFAGAALEDLGKAWKRRLQMVCVCIMNRMSAQSSGFTQRRRMALGIVILLLVDVIWVASSELTSYVFTQYNKPFFSTFAKTSMFVLYLLGFIIWKPWRQQCTRGFRGKHAAFFADAEGYFAACTTDTTMNSSLSEPLYVPVKFHDLPSEKPENTNIDTEKTPKKSRVRFSNIMEIRQLPSSHALEAKLSRMSYPTVKEQESILKTVGKLTATQVAKISFFFCFVVQFSWLFFAGAIPVFFSFFIVTLLCHYNNWDPVMVGIRRIFAFICRKHRIQSLTMEHYIAKRQSLARFWRKMFQCLL
ncbi:solute carrier family 35 member F5 isoform X6 [Myotis myotis]|uniref:solute carrier family 35 member F5 isoform X6 n=1 Tax=Myotis myotis TaxID=51298 RepID=UPI001747FCB9|nr:solute carrier family 35 member F5 isoform X6 [Myotis myotis]XP_059560631.1 solute carrier family 35 member F5 isoform X8 [Myotis daubentonii]